MCLKAWILLVKYVNLLMFSAMMAKPVNVLTLTPALIKHVFLVLLDVHNVMLQVNAKNVGLAQFLL